MLYFEKQLFHSTFFCTHFPILAVEALHNGFFGLRMPHFSSTFFAAQWWILVSLTWWN